MITKTIRSMMLLVVLVMGSSLAVFADDTTRTRQFRFSDDFNFSGTTFDSGVYEIKFDEATGELSLRDDDSVLLRTRGRMVPMGEKARYTSMTFNTTEAGRILQSIKLEGTRYEIIVEENVVAPVGF